MIFIPKQDKYVTWYYNIYDLKITKVPDQQELCIWRSGWEVYKHCSEYHLKPWITECQFDRPGLVTEYTDGLINEKKIYLYV